MWARKSHQDSAVRFVTAKSWPPRLGSMVCCGQKWPRKRHQDSAVRFVTAKNSAERATETRQYDLLWPNVGRKSHQDSAIEPARKSYLLAVRIVTAKHGPERATETRFVTARRGPERATKTRQYDLLRPDMGQKEPPRLGSTISYRQTWARTAIKTRQYDLLRPRVGQKEPPRLGSTICGGQTWARKSRQDSAVRFVTAKKSWPQRATETRQYVGQEERLGNTICYGQTWARKSYRDSAVRFFIFFFFFVSFLQPRVGQKEPPRLGSTICYGQPWARKSHRDSAVRFVMTKRGPERATETRQFDVFRPNVGQKQPPRLGSTICYRQRWARSRHQDSAVRFVAKRGPERAIETRQYDLLRPNVGQKEPPRLGSTICNSQELARKSHRDSAIRFVTAKYGPERATETRQYDLLRPNVGQKESPRLGSTICYG